jgi:hypothetical protein
MAGPAGGADALPKDPSHPRRSGGGIPNPLPRVGSIAKPNGSSRAQTGAASKTTSPKVGASPRSPLVAKHK